MPPVCTVNVKGQGELVISGNLPTTTLNFKVGESAYVLKNKLTPEFYVDGKKDYSANISSSWYRIGARSSGQAQKVDSLYSAITSSEVGKLSLIHISSRTFNFSLPFRSFINL